MENINAGQIKKALRVHSHIKHPTMVDCSACAYIWSESCREVLATDILALINSQEQRIKELTEENEGLTSSIKILVNNSADLKFELAQTYDLLEESKADTVSELKTRFAMHFGTYTDKDVEKVSDVFKLIDQIAKEMLEENENETTHSN